MQCKIFMVSTYVVHDLVLSCSIGEKLLHKVALPLGMLQLVIHSNEFSVLLQGGLAKAGL